MQEACCAVCTANLDIKKGETDMRKGDLFLNINSSLQPKPVHLAYNCTIVCTSQPR